MYERQKHPLLPKAQFSRRIAKAILYGLVAVCTSIIVGMIGFHAIEGVPYIDAFQEAAMIYSGMGPVLTMQTFAGKLFAGFYAIFSAFALLVPITIILSPVLHRFLHKFHLDSEQ